MRNGFPIASTPVLGNAKVRTPDKRSRYVRAVVEERANRTLDRAEDAACISEQRLTVALRKPLTLRRFISATPKRKHSRALYGVRRNNQRRGDARSSVNVSVMSLRFNAVGIPTAPVTR